MHSVHSALDMIVGWLWLCCHFNRLCVTIAFSIGLGVSLNRAGRRGSWLRSFYSSLWLKRTCSFCARADISRELERITSCLYLALSMSLRPARRILVYRGANEGIWQYYHSPAAPEVRCKPLSFSMLLLRSRCHTDSDSFKSQGLLAEETKRWKYMFKTW